MSEQQANTSEITIRDYQSTDQAEVRRLFEDGRLIGQIQPNDTAADIDNIAEAYLAPERAHFWVAEIEGRVVGMVGVAEDEQSVAEIRRLRVDPAYRETGVAVRLLETALAFCRHHAYLKVVLDTGIELGPAIKLFERFAFQHTRTRTVHGKEVLDFYIDLYHEPRKQD